MRKAQTKMWTMSRSVVIIGGPWGPAGD